LALSEGSVEFISDVLVQLKTAGINYSRLVLPASSQELDVFIQGQPYFVKFNMHDPSTAREQAGEFLATMHYLQGKSITPASYIDVRLSGRVYYK
jgi:flagellar basal body rod protein FlgF